MTDRSIARLLLIEDNRGDARLLREMINDQSVQTIELVVAESMLEAERHLAANAVDIILLDPGLLDAQGLASVRRARVAAPHAPLVVLTGSDDESLALDALRAGAEDYLIKGQLDPRGLLRALNYAVQRNALEEALFAEKERAQVTLNSIADAVVCTDVLGNLTFLNLVAEQLTGWSSEEACGKQMAEAVCILDGATGAAIPDPMALAVACDHAMHLPVNSVLVSRDGRRIPIEDSVAPIHDRHGIAVGAVIVFRDVSSARAMADQISYSAQHDYLTGLPNRMLLNDRLGQAIALARRHHNKVAVLFLDLDGFKHINDSLGHSTGDRLLRSIAMRLSDCVRGSDTVSRQGGDEFVVLLSEMGDAADAAVAARRMLDGIARAHTIEQLELHISASIGVSIFPDDGDDAETLIKNADMAMYQAKQNGRHSFQFFTAAMNVRAVERQRIEEDLRSALARNEFSLHYQPKVSLSTGIMTGAEALLRWHHPTRGLVPPSQFIPVAEDCGLIVPIGAWVLREACRQTRAWIDAGLSVPGVAVNVSALEFRNERFLERVFTVLGETGLDPRFLEIEVTESVLMANAESATSILQALRSRGVRVALDDFGTGYSSLSYLQRFPVDTLKIDQSFVQQIATGADTTIVTAVIGMAHSLNLRVVAEGVETLDELAILNDQSCDEVQGYFFSRPLPPDQFALIVQRTFVLPPAGTMGSLAQPLRGPDSPAVAADGALAAVRLG